MRKLTVILLLLFTSIAYGSVIKSMRLVWDTGKIATFGIGFGYNIFNINQFIESPDKNGKNVRIAENRIFGPVIDAEIGITGYEYQAGFQIGKQQCLSRSTYLLTFFTGKSRNWMDLKTNITKDHFVFGIRLNQKFIEWAIKYHTDFDENKMISIQFGLGE